MGTKAPYYGSIAVAAALGSTPATVVEIPLDSQTSGAELQPEAAYAIYTSGAYAAHLPSPISHPPPSSPTPSHTSPSPSPSPSPNLTPRPLPATTKD